MKTRTVLFSGTHDALSDPKDVTLLTDEVKHLVFNETIYNWNHVDFIWGVDAPIVLYTQITYLLRKHL